MVFVIRFLFQLHHLGHEALSLLVNLLALFGKQRQLPFVLASRPLELRAQDVPRAEQFFVRQHVVIGEWGICARSSAGIGPVG